MLRYSDQLIESRVAELMGATPRHVRRLLAGARARLKPAQIYLPPMKRGRREKTRAASQVARNRAEPALNLDAI